MHSKIGSFINVFSVRLSRSNLAFGIYQVFSLLRFNWFLITQLLLFIVYENQGFSDTFFRDSVFSKPKFRCSFQQTCWPHLESDMSTSENRIQGVDKNTSKRIQMNGTIIQKFLVFLKLQKLHGNIFPFPKDVLQNTFVGFLGKNPAECLSIVVNHLLHRN